MRSNARRLLALVVLGGVLHFQQPLNAGPIKHWYCTGGPYATVWAMGQCHAGQWNDCDAACYYCGFSMAFGYSCQAQSYGPEEYIATCDCM